MAVTRTNMRVSNMSETIWFMWIASRQANMGGNVHKQKYSFHVFVSCLFVLIIQRLILASERSARVQQTTGTNGEKQMKYMQIANGMPSKQITIMLMCGVFVSEPIISFAWIDAMARHFHCQSAGLAANTNHSNKSWYSSIKHMLIVIIFAQSNYMVIGDSSVVLGWCGWNGIALNTTDTKKIIFAEYGWLTEQNTRRECIFKVWEINIRVRCVRIQKNPSGIVTKHAIPN